MSTGVKINGIVYGRFENFYYPVEDFDPDKVVFILNRGGVVVDYPGSMSELEVSLFPFELTDTHNPLKEEVKRRIAAKIRKEEKMISLLLLKIDTLKEYEDTLL